ncbi:MAG: SpoIIE family protein phosphatase [Eubacteriales bacterium]|nr:SpoIIE family protein phosphatase [Eubacteriales bacterium]
MALNLPSGFDCSIVGSIINGMNDWVRLIDLNDNIIFMNRAMSDSLPEIKPGMKCYTAIGRTSPCDNCPSRRAILEGITHSKEEEIGGRFYSVKSSPIYDKSGRLNYVVEVLRDITEMKELHEKLLEQNRELKFDLSLAIKLQCSLLPDLKNDPRYDFAYIYEPCESLGGDFIDIFRIDRDHTGIYIADISGHGVPASMLTVFLRSSMDRSLLSPAKALKSLYEAFNRASYGNDLYITVFYAIIDLKEKKLVYSNAGHNVCPIVYNKNAKNSSFDILRSAGIPISHWVDSPSYKDNILSLKNNDRLFMYTDGITEVKNPSGEYFGEDRLLEVLLGEKGKASETLDNILEKVYDFNGPENLNILRDDITMALMEIF